MNIGSMEDSDFEEYETTINENLKDSEAIVGVRLGMNPSQFSNVVQLQFLIVDVEKLSLPDDDEE